MNGITAACQGRLASDAELRFLPSGQAALGFRMAVEEHRSDGQPAETQWVSVTAWGDRAAELHEGGRLVKGAEVYCEGRLTLRQWEGQGGVQRSGLSLSAWVCQPLGAIGRKPHAAQRARDQVYRGGARPAPVPQHER